MDFTEERLAALDARLARVQGDLTTMRQEYSEQDQARPESTCLSVTEARMARLQAQADDLSTARDLLQDGRLA